MYPALLQLSTNHCFVNIICVTAMERMPDEILLYIFKFLSTHELVTAVSNVCTRWNEIALGKIMWMNRVFTPPISMEDEEIVRCISALPHLKHFRLKHGKNIDRIAKVLCKNCPDIQTVCMDWKRGPTIQIYRHKCFSELSNIKTFDVFMPPHIISQFDYAILNRNFKLRNTSLFIVGKDMRTEQNWFFGRILPPMVSIMISDDETVDILNKRSDTLEYLILCCKMNERISKTVYKCKNLNKLVFITDGLKMNVISFEGMNKLEHLQTLQIFVKGYSLIKFESNPAICFNELVKLEIHSSIDTLRTDELRRLWPMCPKLQHLKLRAFHLTDEVFQEIGKCKFLKHIDISYNVPGFFNECLEFIAEGCPDLEFLDLSSEMIPFEYKLCLLAPCKKLRCLWLKCHIIRRPDLLLIPTQFPNLAELNIRHCRAVTPKAVKRLQRQLKSLNIIWKN